MPVRLRWFNTETEICTKEHEMRRETDRSHIFHEEWEAMQATGCIGDMEGSGRCLLRHFDNAPMSDEEEENEEFDADLITDGEQSHWIEQQECVGNDSSPQLSRAHGGMSGQQQQERMHVTERQ